MDFPDDNNLPDSGGSAPEEPGSPEGGFSGSGQKYTITETEENDEVEDFHSWSEAKYESSDQHMEGVYSPSVNTHTEQKSGRKTDAGKPRGPIPHLLLKAVCLVLACVVLSAAACYVVIDYRLSLEEPAETVTTTQVILGSSSTGVTSGVSSPYEGGAANQIYAMACDYQVVGVTTPINTTNIFGQQTSTAVSGTGFVISSDGYIMTNYHVVSYAVNYGYDLIVMFNDNSAVSAEVVGYLEENDVAVIKIDPEGLPLNPVVLGNSDSITPGDVIYAIGNPLGELTYSITEGIVSALDRVITTTDSLTGTSTSINMFQITAAVNSGNSGGPVYNEDGEVIGIVTAKYSDSGVEGLGFAIPINDAVSISTQLIEKGYVAGASLGITCMDIDYVYSSFTIQYYNYPYGVVVLSVNQGSAAETAGILVNDIITSINGTEVSTTDELKLELRKLSPGDSGVITVYRPSSSTLGVGEYIDLPIVFDETSSSSSSGEAVLSGEDEEAEEDEEYTDDEDDSYSSFWDGFDFPFFGSGR